MMRNRISLVLLALCIGSLNGCGHAANDASAPHANAGSGSPDQALADRTMDAGTPDATSPDSKSESAQAGTDAAPQVDESLMPLSPDDIQLYLTVMRAAAERVRHPTPEDLAAIQQVKTHDAAEAAATKANATNQAARDAIDARFQPQLDAAMKAAASSGNGSVLLAAVAEQNKEKSAYPLQQVPSLDSDVQLHAFVLGQGEADSEIVTERHLDETRYGHVKDVIENIIDPNPAGPSIDGRCDGCGNGISAAEWAKRKAQAKKISAMKARNSQALAPYAAEIRSLQQVVRKGKE